MMDIISKAPLVFDWLRGKLFFCMHGLTRAASIPTHLSSAEKRRLFLLARSVGTGQCVEIGSFVGASSCFLAAGLAPKGMLLCIDTWGNDAMSEGKRDTYQEFINNTIQYRERIVMIRGYSTDVVDRVREQATVLDLLFIDGDHSYEGCKKDWDLYSSFVKPGGIVVFHDYGWAEGVKKVVEEDAKPRFSAFGSLPNMFWGWMR